MADIVKDLVNYVKFDQQSFLSKSSLNLFTNQLQPRTSHPTSP